MDVLGDWKAQLEVNASESHLNVKPDITERRLRLNAERTRGVGRNKE